jgi:mono/diheme cytochrome c family protein
MFLIAIVLPSVGVSAQQPASTAVPAVPADIEQWMRAAWGVDPKTLGYTDTHFLLSLTDSERQGAFLFKQRCNACHYSMVAAVSGAGTGLLSSKTLAPALSKKNVEGQEEKVRQRIAEGSANMPAFKYGLKPAQIDLIISYLKKVEDPDMTTTFLKRVLKR